MTVALRKESVDRNTTPEITGQFIKRSLSARRAWIEIALSMFGRGKKEVALRKESVDRNLFGFMLIVIRSTSLSARRAWIEISVAGALGTGLKSRSPQGERG